MEPIKEITLDEVQYFSVTSGYLYILTYTAQEALFSEHLEEVHSIVTNFVY